MANDLAGTWVGEDVDSRRRKQMLLELCWESGLKILHPASYLMLPSDTKQYLSTLEPLKQAYVLFGITR